MFSEWTWFYELTGAAAATLIGLLFIVATLSSNRPRSPDDELQPGEGQALFTTPIVFHLALVLTSSALALAPGTDRNSASFLMTLCAGFACLHAGRLALRIHGLKDLPHWSDRWCYGLAPAVVDGALAAAAFAAWRGVPHAAYGVGLALLVMLMLAIRNAWDLVTWLAPRNGGAPPPAAS